MRTLGELDELRSSEKSNNFTLLRLIGASLVIYGHAPAIAAASPTYTDFFGGYLHFDYSGDIGLYMFFLISGFLVTKSSRQTGSVPIFLWHRLLRIMPAFIVCVLLCTFLLGGFVTTMPFGKYVIDPSTRVFLWNVSLIDKFAAYLPGVMFTRRYYGMTVDGSLWSLFVEVRLYLMIAILGGLGVFRSNLVANLVFLSIVGLGVGFPGHLPMIAYSRDAMMVSALFLFGGAIHINRKHIFIDYYVLVLLAIACYLSRSDSLCYHLLFLFTLSYAVFVVAYGPKIPLSRFVQDYSYGTYLYGWPVQEILAHLFPRMGPLAMTASALPLSWCLGALSWFAIEKPFLVLKRRPWSKEKSASSVNVATVPTSMN